MKKRQNSTNRMKREALRYYNSAEWLSDARTEQSDSSRLKLSKAAFLS